MLAAIVFGIVAGMAAQAGEPSDEAKKKAEERRRQTLRAAGIDPDAGKKAEAAKPKDAQPNSPNATNGTYTYTITGMM